MTNQLTGLAALGLFTGASQVGNFGRMTELMPSRTMAASSCPRPWPIGDAIKPPLDFEFEGHFRSFEETFKGTETVALLLLKEGAARYERYDLSGGPDVLWLSMSLAKSFVSALVGIAIDEGHISCVDDAISDYITVAAGSAYDGVSIRDVLRMSSGARWSEDYTDPTADPLRLAASTSAGGSLQDFVESMRREIPPGQVCRYNSGDTQALGMLLTQATQRPLADYMQEKLCEPLGMTAPSAWLTDARGLEAAFGCLTMTARDFARLGELYRNLGRVGHQQVVPAKWVQESVTVAAPHLAPGQVLEGGNPVDLGYGYQWWIPDGDAGEFAAIGVYNQFVFVDPSREVVIVKLSANRRYGVSSEERDNRETENLAFLRALAAEA